ncbi:hypothetical protein HH308_20875 [Gordonia sp. TBRC 11910]|uniref:FAD-binding domain-containing protein n=1 Tax=Gordonia asplenii TaxID=2725283 RepID=A0A848L4Z1_9ACTN|nr:FAD-dependent monooxygenase [Gordonia asplenii]NMO03673.1 hypothetical protein [Gordonia asplenii]
MKVPPTTQVVIAGAGPVGLSAAIELGHRGIDCVIVEPRAEPTRLRPRAKTLNMRTLEHIRRWGLEEALRARAPLPPSWSSDVSFATTLLGTEITRFSGVLGLSDPDGVAPVLGQQLPQYVLEDLFREVVAELPTCTLAVGSRVADVRQDDAAARVRIVDETGGTREVEACYVLGADGGRSIVRDTIGAKYVGHQALSPNVGIVFRDEKLMSRLTTPPAVQTWLINDEVPGLMGPVDRTGTWWLIAFGVDGTAPDFDPAATVAGALGEARPVEIVSIDPWTARMEMADRCRAGRCFLIGDAAHLNPPFGGHGLNTGIGDAVDIGWKMAAVLDGWGGPALLDSYEAERRALQQRIIDEAAQNMSVLSTDLIRADLDAPDDAGRTARTALAERISATKRREYFSLDLVLGQRYSNSSVLPTTIATVEDWPTRACVGRRLPHAWLSPGRSTLDMVGPEYTLLMLDDEPVDRVTAAANALTMPLRVEHLRHSGLAETMGAKAVIVRPDQIVAWHGTGLPDDPTSLLSLLAGDGRV